MYLVPTEIGYIRSAQWVSVLNIMNVKTDEMYLVPTKLDISVPYIGIVEVEELFISYPTILCIKLKFFFFSQALKEIPLGIAYTIWAGSGLVLTALVSVLIFKQNIDLAGFIGIGLILVGVVILNVFSKSRGH